MDIYATHTGHVTTPPQNSCLVGWLCCTSHRQRGHLKTASPFTVPCEGRGAWFIHCSHRESNRGLSRGSPSPYRCATPAPLLIKDQPLNVLSSVADHQAEIELYQPMYGLEIPPIDALLALTTLLPSGYVMETGGGGGGRWTTT